MPVALGFKGEQSILERYERDRASLRLKTMVALGVLLVLVLFSLCTGTSRFGLLYSPLEVVGCYGTWLQLNVVALIDPSVLLHKTELLEQYPMYYEVIARLAYTFITVVCGMLLAVAGMLYQNVFRNPIAAPSMLGVTSGISFGCMMMVWVFGQAAASATFYDLRFAFCFVGGVVVLLIVLALGGLVSGKRTLNMLDVMLVATILTGILNAVINYVVNSVFSDTEWTAYFEVSNVTDLTFTPLSLGVLVVVSLLCCIPVFWTRFQMNAVAFSDQEMRLLGVSPVKLRLIALACGSLMIVVAQTYVGTAAMISLVVPFVSRGIFGAEFRRQAIGNVLIGAIVLLACRILISFIPFVGDGVPLGTMVSLVTLPAFAWVMVVAQRQWNNN